MHVRLLAVVLFVLSLFAFFPPFSEARSDTRVKGYMKKNGKHASPYKRKSPNKSRLDNYGTKGM